MVRTKNLVILRKHKRPVKNSNETVDEIQNSKKTKVYDNAVILFDEKFKDLIKTAVDLFHNRVGLTTMSFRERLAYLQILKKLTFTNEWKSKKIISTSTQFGCIINKMIENKQERRDLTKILEKFIDYKLASFPGNSTGLKASSLAKHYKSELKGYGITIVKLTKKIEDLKNAIDIAEGIVRPPKTEKSRDVIKRSNMYKKICRLCGSKYNLYYNINYQKADGSTFRDLIQNFCRIQINNSNDLPQLVCKTCKNYIDGFSEFSQRVSDFQCQLDQQLSQSQNIKVESNVDLGFCEIIDTNEDNAVEFGEVIDLDSSIEVMSVEENVSAVLEEEVEEESNEPSECINDLITDDEEILELPQHLSSPFLYPEVPSCHVLIERLPIKVLPDSEEEYVASLQKRTSDRQSKKRTNFRARTCSFVVDVEGNFTTFVPFRLKEETYDLAKEDL